MRLGNEVIREKGSLTVIKQCIFYIEEGKKLLNWHSSQSLKHSIITFHLNNNNNNDNNNNTYIHIHFSYIQLYYVFIILINTCMCSIVKLVLCILIE